MHYLGSYPHAVRGNFELYCGQTPNFHFLFLKQATLTEQRTRNSQRNSSPLE